MTFQVSSTLKVAIQPSDPADLAAFMKGLRLLISKPSRHVC